ncbi:hypothetical protein MKW92_005103 [Papaver armeniacum]|nr:hypothetical protein MKW92_005103 [Papaver armeniacum]
MWFFKRKGPSGFSYSNTAEDVTHGIDGTGLTAIVTGASSGIGSETARVLAMRGVHVIMGVRNMAAGKDVKETILKANSSAKVDVMELDLSSMASVRKFALEFKSLDLPLNLLINNAGVMACPFMLSHDNIEMQFAINHLGRIVNVSSEVHRFAYKEGIRFDKINDQPEYNQIWAYGQSKLANILHANELTRRFKEGGVQITANSLHPGIIMTNILRHHSIIGGLSFTLGKPALKNVQQGASTTCYVALHPNVKGVSGEYFMDNNISAPNSQARDIELAKKLWDFTMNLIHS